ncbi:MAG: hypothetical protein ACI9LY_002471 [Arenicella sp.]|jgi:hypothetical protein
MILRRFTQHITEQNWFAVGLDVIVVVVGIFLGMQVTEWNDDRKDESEWHSTLENLQAEFAVNLRTTEENRQELDAKVEAVSQTLKILLACKMQAEDMALFQRGLMMSRGTTGLGLRKRVIESILADTKFQSFLTSSKRQYLQDLLTQFEYHQMEAGFYDTLPFNDMAVKHSAVKLVTNEGKEYRHASLVVLAIPFEEACRDQGFIKSLDWWVTWQSAQLNAAQELLVLFKDGRDTLGKWQGDTE